MFPRTGRLQDARVQTTEPETNQTSTGMPKAATVKTKIVLEVLAKTCDSFPQWRQVAGDPRLDHRVARFDTAWVRQ